MTSPILRNTIPALALAAVLSLPAIGAGASPAEMRTGRLKAAPAAMKLQREAAPRIAERAPAKKNERTRGTSASPLLAKALDQNEVVAPVTPLSPVGPVLNGVGQPNLHIEAIVPVSSPEGFPNSGFCGHNPGGGPADTVRLFVRNVGSAPAGASMAAVHWSHGSMTLQNVPALQVGQSAIVQAIIPQACFGPSAHGTCDFLLEADRMDQVDETEDDADNYANGSCMLPGT